MVGVEITGAILAKFFAFEEIEVQQTFSLIVEQCYANLFT